MEKNVKIEICLGYTPVKIFHPERFARLIIPKMKDNPIPPNIRMANIIVRVLDRNQYLKLTEHVTNMRLNDLNLLNTIIGKYMRINIQKFKENELCLHPPIQVGDLVHKEGFLYALILPGYDRLILLHIRGI